jgi:signal transduction histidine kinase
MEYTNLPEVLSGADIQQVSEKATVLVIDDELGPRESLRILLKDSYNVILAINGDEGIEKLKSYSVDTIILDLRMPGKSGIETLEEIRKINNEVPVIILTGFGTLESAQKAVHLNIFEFVSKPFDINEMKDIVKRAVEKQKVTQYAKNITEQLKKLNVSLEDKICELEKFAMVGQLSAELLHEINNPLTIILGYVQMLLYEMANKKETSPEETQKYLAVIENEVKRCQMITRSFLDVSKKPFKYTQVNINTLLENMVSFFKDNPIAKNVTFSCQFDSDIPYIAASPEQLQQVFTNLFMNAIEAMDSKGQITIKTKKKENSVIVKISDTGKGIPGHILEKIFNPFFTTKTEKSTGIGLTISKKIIEAHRGKIYAESEVGKGTTFIVCFPASSSNA